ncbi:unnamed protein product, partial [Diplocarpon coronariae]
GNAKSAGMDVDLKLEG